MVESPQSGDNLYPPIRDGDAIGGDRARLLPFTPDIPRVLKLGETTDIARLLAACDLTVSNSAFGEGFSNALLEGMSCGLPAVATDVGDARAIIGDTGLVVPPKSPDALAQAMSQYFSSNLEFHVDHTQTDISQVTRFPW